MVVRIIKIENGFMNSAPFRGVLHISSDRNLTWDETILPKAGGCLQ